MPKKQMKASKRRTEVKELPKEEQELSKDEQKKVRGGYGIEDSGKTAMKKESQLS